MPRMRRIAVGLAVLSWACLCVPLRAAAQCDTLSGRVRAGQSWEQPFGDGLVFRLRANAQPPPNPAGWTIEVRQAPEGEHDFVWVATPPYRWWNPRYLDTSYGVSARDAVARDRRAFRFVTGEEAYATLSKAVELLIFSRPADMTPADFRAARDSARVTWRAMLDRAGRGELHITGAETSDSTATRPLGRIERLYFTAALCPGGRGSPATERAGSRRRQVGGDRSPVAAAVQRKEESVSTRRPEPGPVPSLGLWLAARSSGDPGVFWALGAVFLAVGVYLFLYGRRRRALLSRFARRQGLSHEPHPGPELEEELTRTFALEDEGLARAFTRVRDVVGDGAIRLFRCVEALDLARWSRPQNADFHRIAAVFPVDPGRRHWAEYDRDGRPSEGRVPEDWRDPDISRQVEEALRGRRPPAPVSLTLNGGLALLYLMPLRTGSEDEEDLEYLLGLARDLSGRLGPRAP